MSARELQPLIFSNPAKPPEGYPKDPFGNELYLLPEQLEYAYRKDDTTQEEIYAKLSNGDEYYIRPLNQTKDIYAKDASGKHKYAKNNRNDEFYARDGLYRSFFASPDHYAQNHLGGGIYPMDDKGNPLYPQDHWHFRQKYTLQNSDQSYVFGINKSGDEVYAIDEMGNEYYPPGRQIAKNAQGQFRYARNKDSEIIYPVDGGDEYYLSENGDETILLQNVSFKRYARKADGSYFYPKDVNGVESVVDSTYLVSSNLAVYPVDEFGNEYMLENTLANNDYPVTYDGRVIVQSRENSPCPVFYEMADTRVGPSNVKEILYRSSHNNIVHYITDVVTTRKREKKRDLMSFPFPKQPGSGFAILYLIFVVLVGIVILLCSVVCKRC